MRARGMTVLATLLTTTGATACGGSSAPDVTPPKWPAGALLKASSAMPTSATLSWPAATDERPGATLRYRLFRDGKAVIDSDALTAAVTGLVLGEGHVFKVEAGDAANNWTSDGPEADLAGAPPPPKAPPLDRSVATDICAATRFLHEGADALQEGMAPNTLRCPLTALVRGRVFAVTGEGLGGVKVAVVGHAEWGSTLSQGDGQFDLVVEAGQHTLDFTRAGHFPAQRSVLVAPKQWGHAPAVTLKKADSAVTTIVPMQGGMHVSSLQTDKDGTRRTFVYFPPGTQASMQMPDGSSRTLETVHVRATEYTVGPNGEKTMPASLPPSSNYGFAAEFSVDEALAAGADAVVFNRPVIVFLENFLKLPPGSSVPMGYYDRKKARWLATEDARVVTLVSVTAGKADFDLDGDGQADVIPGATDGERMETAKLFTVGAQLSRGRVTHFTAFDKNHNERCKAPEGCTGPDSNPPPKPDGPCPPKEAGSDIDCHSQSLGEDFDVVGTPFRLRYQSNRSVKPGQGEPFTLELAWVGGTEPLAGNILEAQLDVEVAGQKWSKVRAGKPMPGESELFVWDGKDAYGRTPQGPMPVSVTLAYRNASVRSRPTKADLNFLESGGPDLEAGTDGRGGVIVRRTWNGRLGTWYTDSLGLGGLNLSALHHYVPSWGLLYKGDGSVVQADALGATLQPAVGGGASAAEDIPGTSTRVSLPTYLAAAPDGGVYFNEGGWLVRRLSPDGTVRTVAGAGGSGTGMKEDDGIPALQSGIEHVSGLAVDRWGNLYIADKRRNRIYRVDTSGTIRPFAGTGAEGDAGDGGDALKATLKLPTALTVSPDGDVYFLSYRASSPVVRRVRDGVIATVAGGGDAADSAVDSVPALQAKLNTTDDSHLAYGADGSVYFSEPLVDVVRRLGPDGRIHRFAGSGARGDHGDGGPALAAELYAPMGIAVHSDGTIYVCDANNQRLRRVRPDGVVETAAGNGTKGTFWVAHTGTSALRTGLHDPQGALVLPDGTVVLAERGGARISFIKPFRVMSGAANTLLLPSEDGAELYVFGDDGKHRETLDGLTKALKHEFKYSASGTIASIVDGFGNTTEVLRDAEGRPLGLKSPDGLVTTLKLDAQGRAISVINPANEETKLTYGVDGLLSSRTDPRGNTSRFEFDKAGRLMKDTNAAGGSKSLVRTTTDGLVSVSVTTAGGRTTRHDRSASDGHDVRKTTFPDGTVAAFGLSSDGSNESTSPDLNSARAQFGPDPRFGMAAPVLESLVVKTPSGLQRTVGTTRSVTFATAGDVLSDTKAEEVTTVNGKIWRQTWETATRTLTITSPVGRVTSARFDANGLLVEEQEPDVLPVLTSYDSRGRVVKKAQGMRSETATYDVRGNLASVTDALGRVQSFAYDATGRITKETLAGGQAVEYGYDASGNLASVTPPGQPSHGFTYTSINLAATYLAPAVEAVTAPTQYSHDLDKNPTRLTRPDGQRIELAYDTGGRLSRLTTPTGARTYTYAAASGQLTATTIPGAVLGYTYDGGLLLGETWAGIFAGAVVRTYNSDFALSGLSVQGANVAYEYDNDALLVKAGDLILTRGISSAFVTGTTLGSTTTNQNYNEFGELSRLTATQAGTTVLDIQYTRDHAGRITQQTAVLGGQSETSVYSYDAAGRLTGAMKNGVSTVYGYDANGNRLRNDEAQATYDKQDRLLTFGGNSYDYTANGELKTRSADNKTTMYTYDVMGNLTEVTLPDGTLVEYVVDGRNRRIGKKVNGTLVQGFLYEGALRPVAELDKAGTLVSRFVYGTDGNVPEYLVKAGITYRLITDHLGSPRVVVDTTSGAITQRMDYDSFGRVTADTNPGFQPFGFAGGLFDTDTKLVRFGARDYDAEAGRWTTKDPILFAGQDANLYAYAFNDPINRTDPAGLTPPSNLLPKILPPPPSPPKDFLPKKSSEFAPPPKDPNPVCEQSGWDRFKGLLSDPPSLKQMDNMGRNRLLNLAKTQDKSPPTWLDTQNQNNPASMSPTMLPAPTYHW